MIDAAPGEVLATAVAKRLGTALSFTNVLGAALAMVLGWLVVPGADAPTDATFLLLNAVVLLAFLAQTTIVGMWWARRRIAGGWYRVASSTSIAQRDAQRRLLRTPLAATGLVAIQWIGGTVLIGAVNLRQSKRFVAVVATTGLFTALAMCGVAYLLSERLLRPVAARALAIAPVERGVLVGIAARQILGWTLGTGSAVMGLLLIAVVDIVSPRASADDLTLAIVVFCLIVLCGGLLVECLTARAVADPFRCLRDALAAVEHGDLDTQLPVDDATDVGLVQDGFNRMVGGLRERERTRAALERHVGADVAQHALAEGGRALGGTARDVSVLFVDIIGSTELAARSDPADVVAVLNRFFEVVVTAVREHGGAVNKFAGDAALAIFGAPDPLDDQPTRALAAARTIAGRLATQVPEIGAGIGVSGGRTVAGNIGAVDRHEYTVIGDPVNEAARLSDAAKNTPGCVAAAGHLVDSASATERLHWHHYRDETLRGRSEPTHIMSTRRS